jgi:N-acyl-D-amino-acid deacylase
MNSTATSAATPRLIVNATVIDGTGTEGQQRDIVVVGDRIERLSPPGTEQPRGHEVLDAGGLVVCPGFVDVHSHADNAPFLSDDDTSKILQGVTTEVVGNCGFSLAPVSGEKADQMRSYSRRIFPELPWGWTSFGDFVAATDAAGYVTNYAPLLGHHAVRVAVLGMDDRAPSPEEQQEMEGLVDAAMAEGAFGLSSGLIYPPGLFARTEEIIGLASRLPEGRPYVTHMRGESTGLLDSLHEAVRIGREGGCALHVSHLKVAGRNNWGSMPEALAIIDGARRDGLKVAQDVYPYTAGSTMLTAV